MNDSVSQDLPLSENDNIQFVNGCFCLVVTAIIALFFPILYKKIRCKFPVTVNCWFCNKNTKVPYDDANCWDCPFCEQYNGFNKDGGYNKVIKEQHTYSSNFSVFTGTARADKNGSQGKKIVSNGFCRLCNINQQLKIQQLARFVPLNEDDYDEEVEQFRQKLEASYRLCSQCEKTLTKTLRDQQYNLLKHKLNEFKDKNEFFKLNSGTFRFDLKRILCNLRRVLCSGLKLISGFISFMLLLSFIFRFETEQHFLKEIIPMQLFLDSEPFLQEFLYYLKSIYSIKKGLICIGLLCYALSSLCRQIYADHPSLLLFWGFLYALSWTDATGLQLLVSVICIVLSVFEIQQVPKYKLKKLLKDESYQSQSTWNIDHSFVPEVEKHIQPQAKCDTPLGRTHPINVSLNESEESDKFCNYIRTGKKFKDKELSLSEASNDESLKSKSKTGQKAQLDENQTPKIKSKSVFNKNFLSKLENSRIEKELSPPPEIFHNLKNLHIGNNSNISERQTNFLFHNHNFEEKIKKTSPIIKPPKFVRPPSNSWSNGDLHETISRSSTPSSGYSSQKAEKGEARSSFHFPKVISPVPLSGGTPTENFDYWDRSNPYLNNGNFHYFAPGYLPFQQFPNSLGHTTVYTYTRPTSYPFPYSNNIPSYTFPPVPHSPRFSDASESENLFQQASSSFQSSQKWNSIKSVLYNVSIVFNLISVCVLVYFTWSGIISLTGK